MWDSVIDTYGSYRDASGLKTSASSFIYIWIIHKYKEQSMKRSHTSTH